MAASVPAITILSYPSKTYHFPKTFKTLRKISDSQRRACLAAANSKCADLQRAAKLRGIPAENVFSTHGSFAPQHKQRSRAALIQLHMKLHMKHENYMKSHTWKYENMEITCFHMKVTYEITYENNEPWKWQITCYI